MCLMSLAEANIAFCAPSHRHRRVPNTIHPFRLKERRARDAVHAKWDAMQNNRLRRRISNLSSDQKTYRVLHCCGLRCNAVFCGGDVSVAETTFIQAFAAGPGVR